MQLRPLWTLPIHLNSPNPLRPYWSGLVARRPPTGGTGIAIMVCFNTTTQTISQHLSRISAPPTICAHVETNQLCALGFFNGVTTTIIFSWRASMVCLWIISQALPSTDHCHWQRWYISQQTQRLHTAPASPIATQHKHKKKPKKESENASN